MNDNPYAPPKSTVADTPVTDASPSVPVFFAVSPFKLVVLSLCTWNFYQVFWMYRNWCLVREHSEPRILPGARTLFSVFY